MCIRDSSNTERLLQWQQIQNGGADIVVGTRSAVFAPLPDSGVIIIDEEQEHTYHAESAPRYSAHDVAKRRAAAHGALLLLASATPSTESYYACLLYTSGIGCCTALSTARRL